MPREELVKTHAATPGEKRAIVRGMFDRIAPTYDLLNHLLSLGIDRRWRKKTIDLMGVGEGAVILDLACGTGDLSEEAARRDATAIFAVDPSHKMLLRARAKMQYRLTRTYFVESYGEELPLANTLCTHAMIAFGIRNVQERTRAFAEIYRILKPGGVFAVLEFTPMDRKLVSLIFNLYFQKVLPTVGGIISRDRQAYEYLPESVARFVTSRDLTREAEAVGFKHRQSKVFFFGVATCILLEK
ncbi:MAG: bifunctional demethylmenaquinone methyltransferase/2-methoxy-6-polyprenyl-1,4-benzoquinol methylase UbiE [Spirochaetes bacterium]|nr:bifunctional demethylmenaquinone methyltransferase/2-methoxy-6-polyprenyl-1,4-benzoquinol methylase UbiE [Spirochaetota bacterium]